jgi:hypothetical protein
LPRRKRGDLSKTRASAFTFKFRETTKFRRNFNREVEKVEEGREKRPKNKNLFDFFDFAVNLFFKICCFSGNIDVEKVNADALV